jgi:cell division protein FtsB
MNKVFLNMPKRLPKFLKNRYVLVVLFFVLYITFFDAHDLISQIGIRWKIHNIEQQMDFLNKDTQQAKDQIIELTTDSASLEKFAREEYRMKRENEEIFVIINDEEN